MIRRRREHTLEDIVRELRVESYEASEQMILNEIMFLGESSVTFDSNVYHDDRPRWLLNENNLIQ